MKNINYLEQADVLDRETAKMVMDLKSSYKEELQRLENIIDMVDEIKQERAEALENAIEIASQAEKMMLDLYHAIDDVEISRTLTLYDFL